jgi:hypothetical protein
MFTFAQFHDVFFPDGKDKEMASELITLDNDEIARLFFENIGHDNYTVRELAEVESLASQLLAMIEEVYVFQYNIEFDTGYEYFTAN